MHYYNDFSIFAFKFLNCHIMCHQLHWHGDMYHWGISQKHVILSSGRIKGKFSCHLPPPSFEWYQERKLTVLCCTTLSKTKQGPIEDLADKCFSSRCCATAGNFDVDSTSKFQRWKTSKYFDVEKVPDGVARPAASGYSQYRPSWSSRKV